MKQPPSKHISYYEVLEALEDTRACALCELEARDVHRYLENLLYESVNDAGVRAKLLNSRGFCNRHVHEMLEFNDGLGTAILYKDQVKRFLGFLEKQQGMLGRFRQQYLRQTWNREDLCPACVLQSQSRQRYVRVVLDWLEQAEMWKAFEDSPGSCVPHLLLLLGQAKDASLQDRIIAMHVEKYSGLVRRLDEHIRSNSYQQREEDQEGEADSWRRAVRMMAGKKGVF